MAVGDGLLILPIVEEPLRKLELYERKEWEEGEKEELMGVAWDEVGVVITEEDKRGTSCIDKGFFCDCSDGFLARFRYSNNDIFRLAPPGLISLNGERRRDLSLLSSDMSMIDLSSSRQLVPGSSDWSTGAGGEESSISSQLLSSSPDISSMAECSNFTISLTLSGFIDGISIGGRAVGVASRVEIGSGDTESNGAEY